MPRFDIDSSIYWIVALSVVFWNLATWWLLPRLRTKLLKADDENAPGIAAQFTTISLLRTLASCASVAVLIVLILLFLWTMGIRLIPATSDGLETMQSIREYLDSIVNLINNASLTTWILTTVLLGIVLIAVNRGVAKRNWQKSLAARKESIKSSLSEYSMDELEARLTEQNTEKHAQYRAQLSELQQLNKKTIETVENSPILEWGDGEEKISLLQLTDLRDAFLQSIDQSRSKPDEPELETGESITILSDEEIQNAKHLVSTIDEAITEFQKRVEVPIVSLDGSVQELPLVEARQNFIGQPVAAKPTLIEMISAEEVSNHISDFGQRAGAEAETFSQWVKTATTGVVPVSVMSRLGKISARAALVAIFAGFLGFAAAQSTSSLQSLTNSFELSLILKQTENLATDLEPSAEDTNLESVELASEDATIRYLRQGFRATAARSLIGSVTGDTVRRRTVRRNLFAVAAADTRTQILNASTRPGGGNLDTGRKAQQFAVHAANAPPPQTPETVFDEALDRQIRELRKNESTWMRLRQAAAKPSRPSAVYAAAFENFLIPEEVLESHASRKLAARSANMYVAEVVTTGSHPKAINIDLAINQSNLTARERRMIGEGRSALPMQLQTAADNYRRGVWDPGSIRRVSPSTGQAVRVTTGAYESMFPVTEVAGNGAGGAPSSNNGSRSGGSNPSRSGSRSYGRVRFNPRVGGVVIGREPDTIGDSIDIVDISWTPKDRGLLFALTTREGDTLHVGPIRRAVLHHAMAYVADGRVVVTTLPQSLDRPEGALDIPTRPVVVHPAFEDTAFACAAIQIDRFVDTFLYQSEDEVNLSIQKSRNAVQELGRLLFIAGILPSDTAQYLKEEPDALKNLVNDYNVDISEIQTVAKSCEDQQQCFPIAMYEELGFSLGGATEYLNCLSNQSDGESCINLLVTSIPRASYSVDSGVRETTYTVDKSLHSLALPSDTTSPIHFMVQAVPVPVTADYHLPELPDGTDPWQFPNIASRLNTLVVDGIDKNDDAKTVLQTMREFVVAQRFFRLALDGHLGLDFPIDTLVELQKSTKDAIQIRRNERWNHNTQFVNFLETKHEQLIQELRFLSNQETTGASCLQSIEDSLSNIQTWPAEGHGIWPLVADFETICPSESAPDLVDLRDQLRSDELIDEAILIADRWNEPAGLGCPLLR